MPTCIDLTELCGKKYRVTYEESYYAQYGPKAYTNDPWLKIIPCQNGHIYPHGGNRLAVSANSRKLLANLMAVPGAELWQDASDGVTILFDVANFEQVAQIMKPRTVRHLSEEHRRKLTESGTEALKRYRNANVESSKTV